MECTVLQCFMEQEWITGITPVYRDIKIQGSGKTLVESVIQIRQAFQDDLEKQGAPMPGHVLLLKSRVEILVFPRDFAEAASANPDLVQPVIRYYYTGSAQNPADSKWPGKKKSAGTSPFRYRSARAGLGAVDGLMAVTVLTRDLLKGCFELVELMIDSATPAASILQFLSDMTDGRVQAIAAFPGNVGWLLSDPLTVTGPESRRKAATIDPLSKALATLLDAALVGQGFLAEDPDATPARSLDWLANLLKSSTVIAIETDLPFSELILAQAMKDKAFLPLVLLQPAAPPDMSLIFAPPTHPSCVVLPMSAYTQLIDPERVAHELTTGGHSVLIGCTQIQSLPEPLRRIIETTITLPRIDRPVFDRMFSALFGAKPNTARQTADTDTWIQYVQPWDLARIARTSPDPSRAFVLLRHRVEDRLSRVTPHHGPSLKDLHGMGEARVRAGMLIADVQAAVAGDLPWSQVDRGMLLAGPPGCGKTALARAMAKDCGIRFVECSAARWQMVNHLGEHLGAMARDFAEARRFEPSILFIDEIDSIGNRDHFSGANASYHTQVVNALLAELQGFSERGKVIVIAATNDAENVDPALRRAGRLDRVVRVSLPTIDALEKIFAYYLEKHNAAPKPDSNIILRPLAESAFGRTGADVSLMVRGALRRARLTGRPLCQDDLLAELFERPLEWDLDRPLNSEGIRRVALHEAGHALVRLKSKSVFGHISFISIVPRSDGSLGFVALKPNTDAATLNREDFLSHLRVTLGGRAAEEVFYGPNSIGAGAGGNESSDLARATAMAFDMICRLGFGKTQGLLWRNAPGDEDCNEAISLLNEAYEQARRLILSNRGLVEKIAAVLIERQEISGEELKKIVV